MSDSIWAAKRYGWDVLYWLEIEGISTIYIERETALSLPAGYTQDASLVVDMSSEVGEEVDTSSGVGHGFPFTFSLLDTAGARYWMERWQRECHLTAAVTSAGDLTVDDTSGLLGAPGDTVWLGMETITYTGKTPTTLTGCTRGLFGSLAAPHSPTPIGGWVTNRPRFWRGRQVRLFASPIDPAGHEVGAALMTNTEEVWRGTIDRGPLRVKSLWQFDCLALDRRLSLPVMAPITGRVSDSLGRYPCSPTQSFVIWAAGWDATLAKLWEFYIVVYPYEGYAAETLLTTAKQIELMTSKWTAAVAVAKNVQTAAVDGPTYLGDLKVFPIAQDVEGNNAAGFGSKFLAGSWNVLVYLVTDAATNTIALQAFTAGSPLGPQQVFDPPYYTNWRWLQWNSGPDLLHSSSQTSVIPKYATGLTVELDAPHDSIPSTGIIKVGGAWEATYESKALVDDQSVYFGGIKPKNGGKPLAWLVGQNAEIVFRVTGAFVDIMRQMLESSGENTLRGDFDLLDAGQGYALRGADGTESAIDEASFAALANGPMIDLQCEIAGSGVSWIELFQGVLGLAQRAIVSRQDAGTGARRVRLGLVSVEAGGSDYTGLITDVDLLTGDGPAIDAIVVEAPVNTISVEVGPDKYIVEDGPSVAVVGPVTEEYKIPASSKADLLVQLEMWATARFAQSQTTQTIQVRCVPWAIPTGIETGDLVYLSTSHYGVWQWSTGSIGYAGVARVLGVARRLLDGALTVKLLLDGALVSAGLCPSGAVVAGVGLPGAPTSIDLERRFYNHFSATAALGGLPFTLWCYDPGGGSESGGGTVTVSAVTDTGSVCRLTISGSAGVAIVVGQTYLTLPNVAGGNAYQDGFAHTSVNYWS